MSQEVPAAEEVAPGAPAPQALLIKALHTVFMPAHAECASGMIEVGKRKRGGGGGGGGNKGKGKRPKKAA